MTHFRVGLGLFCQKIQLQLDIYIFITDYLNIYVILVYIVCVFLNRF